MSNLPIDQNIAHMHNSDQMSSSVACIHSSLATLIHFKSETSEIYVDQIDDISEVCRHGHDFQNDGSNSLDDMQKVLSVFKSFDTIRFTSMITNEEALILQELKELHGFKLVNQEAYNYQKFVKAFSKTSGNSLYIGTTEGISNSDYIVIFGTKIASDIPELKLKIDQASKNNNCQTIYMHPIEDESIQKTITQFIKYEAGSEDGVIALVAKEILKEHQLSEELNEYFEDFDEGYISAESNVGEEEIRKMRKNMLGKTKLSFIVGSDLYAHPHAENIAKILGLLECYTDFQVTITPPSVNTLGVSLICDLDEKEGKKVIGYNDVGDFILSSIENEGDINMPALNQQEGTFTNLDKKVVSTNILLPFDGFYLNDIANNLGLNEKYTINYTAKLSIEKGYKDKRIVNQNVKINHTLLEIEDIESFDGVVIYISDPSRQKNVFTNLCKNLKSDNRLLGSEQFAIAAKIKDGDEVEISVCDSQIIRRFLVDKKLKGTIGILSTFDMGFEGQKLKTAYRFNKVNIKQVGR